MIEDRPESASPLLRLRGLSKVYRSGAFGTRADVRAVTGVDLELRAGETLALVGESGCGKSTLGRMIVRLTQSSAGHIELDGTDITTLGVRAMRPYRPRMQLVFQDPFAALNPRLTIEQIVTEPARINRVGTAAERRERARTLLDHVGLPEQFLDRRPGQLSGGQRQRVNIARALCLDPQLLVLDEAVSALDVSVQAQVINLLQRLQDELGLSYLFITHDLSVVRHVADRVVVMYLGRVVETGPVDQVFENPATPIPALFSRRSRGPSRAPIGQGEIILEGDLPSPSDPPSGCAFRTRCWKAEDLCAEDIPLLRAPEPSSGNGVGTAAACHFPLAPTLPV